MIKQYTTTKSFDKDFKRALSGGKQESKFFTVLNFLMQSESLPHQYKDHKLINNYNGRRECHIEPDWLLIYRIEDGILTLERTGSHSDLF